MACDTAFRIIARRHLNAVVAQHEGTCSGDPDALHQIRIALTSLRTAIRFFSPMIDDAIRPQVWAELKWLNSQLGMVRDLDVAIERIVAASGDELALIAQLQAWQEKRAESHRLLARALQSARYRRLIEQTSSWIESGPWSTRRSKDAIRLRRLPLANHAAPQLMRWEKALLKKSRKLEKLGVKKRHRLRLLNKRLTYSIESLGDLFSDKSLAKQKALLKQLRKAQRSLGQLNDGARSRTLAKALNREGAGVHFHFLGRKGEKRLLHTAATAYKKLDKAKPFRPSDLASNAESGE
jgi:CHAD domain-containing protein